MKALVYDKYGLPDVLELREIDKPVVTDDDVLVRVHASSVNPLDWHTLTGTPYIARMEAGLLKPKREVLGLDFAGTVEAVGRNVKQFQPGDEVFGGRSGAFAEYVCVPEDRAVVLKPANLTFDVPGSDPRTTDQEMLAHEPFCRFVLDVLASRSVAWRRVDMQPGAMIAKLVALWTDAGTA
jgi:NADPH:quinone reductase and related Zn-dependent oxidoreductases